MSKIRFPPLYFYKFMDNPLLSIYKVRNIGSPGLEFQRKQSEHLLRFAEPRILLFILFCTVRSLSQTTEILAQDHL